MSRKTNDGKDRIIRKMLVSSAFGIVLAEVSGAATNVIDGVVTSRFLGSTALAATGMGNICYTILAVLSGILAGGAQSVASKKVGSGKIKEASQIFSMILTVTCAISALIAVLGIIGAPEIANLIGVSRTDAALFEGTVQYIRGFLIGAPANTQMLVLISFVQLEGKNKQISVSAIVMAGADIVGDLLNATVFHGGLFGMGLTTAISFYAAIVVLYTAFIGKTGVFRFRLKDVSFQELGSVIRIGLPRATKRIGNIIRPLFVNRVILAVGGSTAMAAFAVQGNVKYVTEAIGVGMSSSIFLLVGIFVSEKDVTALKSTVRLSIRGIVTNVTAVAIIYFCLALIIVKCFYDASSPAYGEAIQVIRCHAVSLPFLAFNECFIGYMNGIGKLKTAHVITIIERLFLITILTAVLGKLCGVFGIWLSIALNEILLCLALIVISAIKARKNPNRDSAFVLFDEKTEVGSSVEFTITNRDQIGQMQDAVVNFCKEQGMDQKQTYHVHLFFEELCVLIMEHGFDDKKKHSIDLRIYKDQDHFILRTRDDCKALSAADQKAIYEEAKEGKFMGIQMVVKLAKNVQYINSIAINNFIITI